VRLVQEYCDLGSLRDVLNSRKGLRLPGGSPAIDMLAVLDTALDVARAMAHLHVENIVHSDLKARNVLLKSAATDARGFLAKVADFGLSIKINPDETHVSNAYQVGLRAGARGLPCPADGTGACCAAALGAARRGAGRPASPGRPAVPPPTSRPPPPASHLAAGHPDPHGARDADARPPEQGLGRVRLRHPALGGVHRSVYTGSAPCRRLPCGGLHAQVLARHRALGCAGAAHVPRPAPLCLQLALTRAAFPLRAAGEHAFRGTPKALLGHGITRDGLRPQFEADCPFEYQFLACRCWESDPSIRWGLGRQRSLGPGRLRIDT
jgi:hypothetical protein